MKFLIDGKRVEPDYPIYLDDTIPAIKAKLGLDVYLYARRRKHVTAREVCRDGPVGLSKLRTVYRNMGKRFTGAKPEYTAEELELDGYYEVWEALGQTMESSVVPAYYVHTDRGSTPTPQVLLDYLPIVDDLIYGETAVPDEAVYLTRREEEMDVEEIERLSQNFVRGEESLDYVRLVLPATSPFPLDEVFRMVHASPAFPVIGLGGLCRTWQGASPREADRETLTAWGDVKVVLHRDGRTEMVSERSGAVEQIERQLRRANRFVRMVNNALRSGSPLASDVQALEGSSDNDPDVPGFPLFKSLNEATVQLTYTFSYAEVASGRLCRRATRFPFTRENNKFIVRNVSNVQYLPLLRMYFGGYAAGVDAQGGQLPLVPPLEVQRSPRGRAPVAERREVLRERLREALTPAQKDKILDILRDPYPKCRRLTAVVDEALGASVLLVETIPEAAGETILTTDKAWAQRLADELERFTHFRDIILGHTVRGFDVYPNELISGDGGLDVEV